MDKVEIFVDGACRGNPGHGGWGVLMRYKGIEKSFNGSSAETTNNRMELMAAIMALEKLKRSSQVVLTTDSQYVKNGINQWIHNWEQNGWKTAAKKPVKNIDLWQRLHQAISRHDVEWRWVKGHSGHYENEMADRLANEAIDEMMLNSP